MHQIDLQFSNFLRYNAIKRCSSISLQAYLSGILILLGISLSAQISVDESGFFPNEQSVSFSRPIEKGVTAKICINCDDVTNERNWKNYKGEPIVLTNRTAQPNGWAGEAFVRNPPDWLLRWISLDIDAPRNNLDKVNVVRIKYKNRDFIEEKIYHIGVGIQQPKGMVTFFDYESIEEMVGPNGHYAPGDGFRDTTYIKLPDQTIPVPKYKENNYQVDASDKRSFYERPIVLSTYNESFRLILQEKVAAGLSAGTSINFPNKGFQVTARKEITGKKSIRFPLYGGKESFKNLRFRAGGTSQINDQHPCAYLNDPLGLDITGYARNQFNTLYINGVYWTIDFIQEKMDEHWVEKKYGFDSKYVDIIELDNEKGVFCPPYAENLKSLDQLGGEIDIFEQKAYTKNYCDCGSVKDGNGRKFGVFAQSILEDELTSFNYQSLWDYLVYVRFLQNTDMGINNTFMFCDNRNTPIWYVFGNDFDQAFYGKAREKNGEWLKLKNNQNRDLFSQITRLALAENSRQVDFLRRAQDLLNTKLLPSRTVALANRRVQEISHEIQKQVYAWEPNVFGAAASWKNDCAQNQMIDYLNTKPAYLKNSLASDFFASKDWTHSDQKKITIDLDDIKETCTGKVSIQINSLNIDTSWTGHYFPEPSIKISLIIPAGYQFIGWEGMPNRTNLSFEVNLNTDELVLKPIVTQVENYCKNQSQLKISEIYASPKEGEEDWVELYNPGPSSIHLSNLALTDNYKVYPRKYIFPNDKDAILPAGEYLIIHCNEMSYKGWNYANFRLNGSKGEEVYLTDYQGQVISGSSFETLKDGQSFGICDGNYQVIERSTKGKSNAACQ